MATNKAAAHRLGYVGKLAGRDSDSWFTPTAYLERVREALGGIDLDPFSSPEANREVGAKKFFTLQHSAFNHKWSAKRVFMNPPYGRGIATRAVARFLNQLASEKFEAIVLVNNATETKWFQSLLREASAVCFPDHRIAFYNTDGKAVSGNTRGQAFLYFGTRRESFITVFSSIGGVL
jgi:phage N-6-adenine-methyltransferase